jgi:molybdopterin/thiamine biosynthesis adenylyltransferase
MKCRTKIRKLLRKMEVDRNTPVTYEKDDRQVRLWGAEKQKRLYDSRVAVVGSGALSQMILANLAGLGIGNILLIDNSKVSSDDRNEFLCPKKGDNHHGKEKIFKIEEIIRKINSSINISSRYSRFLEAFVYRFEPEVIIDATNNSISKSNCLDYAFSYYIPLISASTDSNEGSLYMYLPSKNTRVNRLRKNIGLKKIILLEYDNRLQGNVTSGVIAGLVTDEVRKLKFQLKDNGLDSNLKDKFCYKAKKNRKEGYKNLNTLVVGAGALGNFVALNLALVGVKSLDIMDFDVIETSNLNRQLLLYDRVGEYKAAVLSERLYEINPELKTNFFNKKFDESCEHLFKDGNKFGKYDVVFCCVDRADTRLLLNNFAVKYNIPIIEGGTGPTAGQFAIYKPGASRCISCKRDLEYMVEKEKQQSKKGGCLQAEASVVIPNIIIGSAMATYADLGNGLDGLLGGTFRFNSFYERKFFVEPLLEANMKDCICCNS